jgi:nucleotide-binding universal stress UspA family protein
MSGILYASDLTSTSRAAFASALAEAKRQRTELTVTHVMPPSAPRPVDGYIDPAVLEAVARGYRKASQKKLDSMVARAKRAGVRARSLLLQGEPAAQILQAARARRAALVVVGTEGRRGIARAIVGSVAGRVVAGAHCPVLTVRGHAR